MDLPDFPDLPEAALRAVLERWGLAGMRHEPLESVGIFNRIFAVGDELILRVPRRHPAFTDALRKEWLAVPAAREAGVKTPKLLIFDDSLELLPVPYTLYRRVQGRNLEALGRPPRETPAVFHDLGRDLARLHRGVNSEGALANLRPEALPGPDECLSKLEPQGFLSSLESRWLERALRGLEEAAEEPLEPVFCHGDIQMSNLMVGASGEYAALLDWGACGWSDPAHDFAGVPLSAVPFMLEGYRTLTETDGTLEARILYRHLHLALFLLSREPQPGKSWAERPAGMMLELLKFMLEPPGEAWERLVRLFARAQ